jgi:acyl-CoA thioesterase FadM
MNMLFRLLWVYVRARWQPASGLLQPFRIPFVVLPADLDICRHMNNGRYFSIMDLGRVDMFVRSGLLDAIKRAGYSVTIAAETASFRRPLAVFQKFTLETRILGWDEKALFIEQRFLRASHKKSSPDLVASGVVRARLVSNEGVPSTEFIRNLGSEYFASPLLPSWVAEWNGKQCEAASRNRGGLGRAPAAGSAEQPYAE